jgi:dihydrofolate synthase/folylpolyglutamate synthase
MIAAILRRHGLRTGSYLSPHLVSYAERVQIDEVDVETHAFAAAIARAAWAAERVNRTLADDDHVTQFELLTAAAFWELARQGAQVVVVEAGLGGRYDATNVIESAVAVLTNVGLEHTRWLGPTLRDIATEKLAVVSEGSTLALGSQLQPEVLEVAGAVVAERGVRSTTAAIPSAELTVGAHGSFQRENFALARLAARLYLDRAGIDLEERHVREAAARTLVPGRMQVVARKPLLILDGAHNTPATSALVQSLPSLLAGRRLGLVLGVLEDKDAAGMLAELLPLCERAWFTAPPSPRALPPATLQSLARQLGFEQSFCESQPTKALEAARDWAHSQRDGAAVLATGSVYLVGDLLAHARGLEDILAPTPVDSEQTDGHERDAGGDEQETQSIERRGEA